MRDLIKKNEEKVRYLIVGGWNTVFGYLSFAILYYTLSHIIHYTVLLVISYIISISNAYFCYKFFVFRTKGNYLREYMRFYLIYGFAFIISLFMLPIAVEVLKWHPLVAFAVITLFTVIISYLGHKNYSFQAAVQKNSEKI